MKINFYSLSEIDCVERNLNILVLLAALLPTSDVVLANGNLKKILILIFLLLFLITAIQVIKACDPKS